MCYAIGMMKITPFARYGALSVVENKLTGEDGNVCQLRGLSTHNVSCYPQYVTPETVTELTERFNLEIFRFAMYSGFADGVLGYADGDDAHRKELEDKLYAIAAVTEKLGIYLLVDWHVLLEHDPLVHADMAEHFFATVCPNLAGYRHIIYEICNEPNGDDVTWARITEYANRVIPVIRKSCPKAVILCGTPCWSQRVDEAAKAPLAFDNLMYTLHFYADTHRDSLRQILKTAVSENKLPVFVSEFGITDASGDGPINAEQAEIWLSLLDSLDISYILWNLSNKAETSAIIKPECPKVTGFADEDFTISGNYVASMIKRPKNC